MTTKAERQQQVSQEVTKSERKDFYSMLNKAPIEVKATWVKPKDKEQEAARERELAPEDTAIGQIQRADRGRQIAAISKLSRMLPPNELPDFIFNLAQLVSAENQIGIDQVLFHVLRKDPRRSLTL